MSITHEKVATVGLEPASPDQAGGNDWNEPHIYETGAFVPVGVFGFDYTYSTDWCQNVGSGAVVGFTRDSDGLFIAPTSLTLPTRAGTTITLHLLGVNVFGLPSGWTFLAIGGYVGDDAALYFYNTSGVLARPPNNFQVRGLVVAQVA